MNIKICAIVLSSYFIAVLCKNVNINKYDIDNHELDNDIVDFDDDYSMKYDRKYGKIPWHTSDFNKNSFKYTIIKNEKSKQKKVDEVQKVLGRDIKSQELSTIIASNEVNRKKVESNLQTSTQAVDKTTEVGVIPQELLSTTENTVADVESTSELDLTVIPLSTEKIVTVIVINQTVTVPPSTEQSEDFNLTTVYFETTTKTSTNFNEIEKIDILDSKPLIASTATEIITSVASNVFININKTEASTSTNLLDNSTKDPFQDDNSTEEFDSISRDFDSTESLEEVPVYTELETEDVSDVPEDYYDTKDIVPTSAPKTDALSVIFGLAGSVVESVVESVAERVVPKGLFDLFKRMQRQSEALEAEKLRSREENGGLGQFTRGVIKSISTGLSKPLSQLMAGVRDIGSLDSDRGFVNSLASGVTSVANSMVDLFKDRVQAIYPGTVWCGDGHSAQARSGDLGLFFFTDTCCRKHDACKMYIQSGETKFGLTNTGLFTRSHCSCDAKFRKCLQKTNSLVSAQIGLTYFNVLGPQCFRRAHPIIRCVRRTRITSLKCEEYELDYGKPKLWQWFDNETF